MGAERVPCTVRVDPDGLAPAEPKSYIDAMTFGSQITQAFTELKSLTDVLSNRLAFLQRVRVHPRQRPRPLAMLDNQLSGDLKATENGLKKLSTEVGELREMVFKICGGVSRQGLMLEVTPPS